MAALRQLFARAAPDAAAAPAGEETVADGPAAAGDAPALVASEERVEELRRSLPRPRWMRRRDPPPEDDAGN